MPVFAGYGFGGTGFWGARLEQIVLCQTADARLQDCNWGEWF